MLTRIWVGTLMGFLAAGVLAFDQHFAPWYPILFAFILFLGVGSGLELSSMLGSRRPPPLLLLAAVLVVLLANWVPQTSKLHGWLPADPWHAVQVAFVVAVLAAFLAEMAVYRQPSGAVDRIALTTWAAAYLGVLPSFLIQLRWLPDNGVPYRAGAALTLAFFVPKACDVGAYFVGRFLGRNRMTPMLSPKKTWEGLVGGLVVAAVVAVCLDYFLPALRDVWVAAAFGVTVGLAGVLGDLAESLVKRDLRQKDAGQSVPGFGGVLDVIDSVVFAAPLAYWWLITFPRQPVG